MGLKRDHLTRGGCRRSHFLSLVQDKKYSSPIRLALEHITDLTKKKKNLGKRNNMEDKIFVTNGQPSFLRGATTEASLMRTHSRTSDNRK